MSGFPPPLPNGGLFNRLPNPPMLRAFPVPLLPLIQPTPLGVTVPAGMSSISAPPIRHPLLSTNPIIGAPPALFPTPPTLPLTAGLPSVLPTPPPIGIPQLKPIPTIRIPKGPSITVFVGNITERAPDKLIQQLLAKCGIVNNWKRIQGSDGKWQAFGFCEFAEPEAAVRAMRVLHDYEICEKKLVVKVDAKMQEKLDTYFNHDKKAEAAVSPKEDESNNKDKESSADGEKDDKSEDKVGQNEELSKKEGADGEEVKLPSDKDDEPAKAPVKEDQDADLRKAIEALLQENEHILSQDPEMKFFKRKLDAKDKKDEKDDKDLADMDLDMEQQNIIHREIGKFRDTYRKDDEKDDNNKREVKDKVRRKLKEENRQRRDARRESPHYRSNVDPVDQLEEIERRKDEELNAKKEQSYRKRLREWVRREEKKARLYKREQEEELREKQEDKEEKVKLLKFLQDYNDDRDDIKHYKGRVFLKRLADRRKEIEEDELDRAEEEKELKAVNAHLKLGNENSRSQGGEDSQDSQNLNPDSKHSTAENGNSESKKLGFVGMKLSGTAEQASAGQPATNSLQSSLSAASGANKKKLVMSEIFNSNDDDQRPTKRPRLPPPSVFLDDNADSNQSTSSKTNQISTEEKKKMIKALIDSIPTGKDELFAATIGWEFLDEALMKKRIRPWINKKISEYIGDDEPELLEFICSKLANKTTAQSLLEDVRMVLDDEAQVFVVKLWRLLIYEIEAKKMGISK